MLTQLTLPIQRPDQNTFKSFYPGFRNQVLFKCLQAFALAKSEPYIYLWGRRAAGCTHLLQACCQHARQQGLQAAYCALHKLKGIETIANLETFEVICIDDMDCIAGNRHWEEFFLHFYNRFQARGGYLLIAAKSVPRQLQLLLPDLISRLASGILFQVHELTDSERLVALQQRAYLRGLQLPDEVGQFLLVHSSRDSSALFAALEKLDSASLALQRKLTIPLVKSVLGL